LGCNIFGPRKLFCNSRAIKLGGSRQRWVGCVKFTLKVEKFHAWAGWLFFMLLIISEIIFGMWVAFVVMKD